MVGRRLKTLDDIGLSDIRMRDALLRASGASDVFTKALSIGTKAWSENTALTHEAEERYKTLESRLGIFKNTISAFMLAKYLLDFFSEFSISKAYSINFTDFVVVS